MLKGDNKKKNPKRRRKDERAIDCVLDRSSSFNLNYLRLVAKTRSNKRQLKYTSLELENDFLAIVESIVEFVANFLLHGDPSVALISLYFLHLFDVFLMIEFVAINPLFEAGFHGKSCLQEFVSEKILRGVNNFWL